VLSRLVRWLGALRLRVIEDRIWPFLLVAAERASEVTKSAPKRPSDFGKSLRPKDQQRDH
jgi:hypothetical protein